MSYKVVEIDKELAVNIIKGLSLNEANQHVLEMIFNDSSHEKVMDTSDALDLFANSQYIIAKEDNVVFDSDRTWWEYEV